MVRELLQEIASLLEMHSPSASDINSVKVALSGDDKRMWDFLVSNEMWGGAGSIADQALLEPSVIPAHRRQLEELLIRLGNEQVALKRKNGRTKMWVNAFKKWPAE